ncbi:MAG: hypothetical protein WEA61_04735 [Anaerolineales bacterium]
MRPYYADTHPDMEALQIRLLRRATPERKMRMLAAMNAAARKLAMAGLRRRHPQASESELRRRLAGLLLGEELATKVYGDKDNDS